MVRLADLSSSDTLLSRMIPDRMTSDRLILRRFARRDIDALTEAVSSSIAELNQWLPWAHLGYGKEDSASYIRDSVHSWREGRAYDFTIRLRSDLAVHIGNISVWSVSRMGRAAEIGYWIRTDRAGSGLATEACQRMLALGFDEMGFHKINLRIASGNRQSERVAEKLGFSRDGILRDELLVRGRWIDHTLFSLLEHEWRASMPAVEQST